jgi:ribosomal protein L4
MSDEEKELPVDWYISKCYAQMAESYSLKEKVNELAIKSAMLEQENKELKQIIKLLIEKYGQIDEETKEWYNIINKKEN